MKNDLLTTSIECVADVYVQGYPTIGVVPYQSITEEECNPMLTNECITYYEKHLSQKFYDDEDTDMICGPELEMDDLAYLKLQKAESYYKKIKVAVDKTTRIHSAIQINKIAHRVLYDNCKNPLVQVTIMAQPHAITNILSDIMKDLDLYLIEANKELEVL